MQTLAMCPVECANVLWRKSFRSRNVYDEYVLESTLMKSLIHTIGRSMWSFWGNNDASMQCLHKSPHTFWNHRPQNWVMSVPTAERHFIERPGTDSLEGIRLQTTSSYHLPDIVWLNAISREEKKGLKTTTSSVSSSKLMARKGLDSIAPRTAKRQCFPGVLYWISQETHMSMCIVSIQGYCYALKREEY